jgi:hypothetical protein
LSFFLIKFDLKFEETNGKKNWASAIKQKCFLILLNCLFELLSQIT